jgi:hypothetical protein
MVRLRALGEGIGRSANSHWPRPGSDDQRLLEIGRNLSRARELVERYGRDVQPTGAEARADVGAARARLMHPLYVAALGTAVALGTMRPISAIACVLTPEGAGPSDHGRPCARSRQLTPWRPASNSSNSLPLDMWRPDPVTPSVLGEVRPTPRPWRLQSALTAWEIQVHRTLATDPDAADLVRIGRVQALTASAPPQWSPRRPDKRPKSTRR